MDATYSVLVELLVARGEEIVLIIQLKPFMDYALGIIHRHQDLALH